MTKRSYTLDDVKLWQESERENLQQTQQIEKRRYLTNKAKLIDKHLPILDKAIETRYLDIHGIAARYALPLQWAYQGYCGMNALPTVIIHPGRKRHLAKVTMDLESLEPHGQWNIYCPYLDLHDSAFRVLMLLAHEWNMSEGHVHFNLVLADHGDEVAAQLLAFFDRQYQAHKHIIDALIEQEAR